jgi:HTH-type transcriptional regulator/antitoxin HigA
MTDPQAFQPDWASPPGDTLLDALDERGWSQAELAQRLGVTPKHVSELVRGKAPLSAPLAGALARVIGSTPEFWLTREALYRAALERQESIKALEADADVLDGLPMGWMVKQGWLRPASTRGGWVAEALRFFGVANAEAWRSTWQAPLAAWRASKRVEKQPGAVAAWLCRAEQLAMAVPTAPFDKAGFKGILSDLRGLSREADPGVFLPKLQALCAGVGVAFVWVPAPPGCPVNGATRWLTTDKALLAVSFRYKADDHFWFSFFHEVGHLLLHGKKLLFIENLDGLKPEEEAQADAFARDLLIPAGEAKSLAELRSAAAVIAFGERVGVSAGVVVGRLQHEKVVPYAALNELKVRYTWEDEGHEDG